MLRWGRVVAVVLLDWRRLEWPGGSLLEDCLVLCLWVSFVSRLCEEREVSELIESELMQLWLCETDWRLINSCSVQAVVRPWWEYRYSPAHHCLRFGIDNQEPGWLQFWRSFPRSARPTPLGDPLGLAQQHSQSLSPQLYTLSISPHSTQAIM